VVALNCENRKRTQPTLVTPIIMFLMWVVTVRTDATLARLPNHTSTTTRFPSLRTSTWRWEKFLFRLPRGPVTVTVLAVQVTVTSLGITRVWVVLSCFMFHTPREGRRRKGANGKDCPKNSTRKKLGEEKDTTESSSIRGVFSESTTILLIPLPTLPQ
jgi:hypothetical protein